MATPSTKAVDSNDSAILLEGDAVDAARLRPLKQLSSNSIRSLYEEVGMLLDNFEKPVVLADALVPDCPIVGASDTFVALSGYTTRDEVLGRNCRFLLKGVEEVSISRSGRKNLRSMIRMCRLIGISSMGTASCCQTNRRLNGDTFLNVFAVGLVMLHEHPFLVGIQSPLPDMGSKGQVTQIQQEHQALIAQIRVLLEEGTKKTHTANVLASKEADFGLPRQRKDHTSGNLEPYTPTFFSGGLSERVILLNNRCSVMRREPLEIPNGCVVVGERPLKRSSQGFFFAIRLEGVLQGDPKLSVGPWNNSWPKLGMTRITPQEMMTSGYPMRGEWCGQSICIGGEFQAFRRDLEKHKSFGKASVGVEVFDGPKPRWQDRTNAPWELEEGDIMGMLCTPEGVVHLMLNHQTVLSVDTGKPLEEGDYHAVVDCQGQAYELMLLPQEMPSVGCAQELPLQQVISHQVVDFVARAACTRAVSSCTFSVSIADPSQPDVPLVAVSPGFEELTGYSKEEILGKNCRFLNNSCDLDFQQRRELRLSSQTGKPFSCLLQNRYKSGELFLNFLDVRGLRVARDVVTGEDIWYLVGIQSDVSDLVDENSDHLEIQDRHAKELQELADHLRRELQAEIAELAMSSLAAQEQRPQTDKHIVSVPAAPDIQSGPKPCVQPMIALLPETSWICGDVEEAQVSETETGKKAPSNSSRIPTSFPWGLLATRVHASRPYMPSLGAFALGVASFLFARLYWQRHQRSLAM